MSVSLLSAPVYTALVAAVLMFLHVALMMRVVMQRGKSEILIGDGGLDVMQQAIRVHANLVENAAIFLIGLGLLELMTGSTLVVGVFGGIFVVSRIAHAVGFGMSTGVTPGRLVGTLGTMISIVGLAGYVAYIAISKL